MWDILIVVTVGLVGGALIQRWRLQAWKELATSCGLEVVKVSSSRLLRRLELEARAGLATVRIESTSGNTGYTLRVLATFPRAPGLFSSLKIRRRYEPGAAHELEVGDEIFDRRFRVEGSTRLVTALLDEETRRLLLGVQFEGEMEISGSELRLDTFGRNLRDLLPVLLTLIRRLTEDGDVTQRLVRNARQDPAAGVRLRNLLALIREHSGDARTLETLRAACADPSPQVRLRAARELGAERRDVLFELAESLEDDAVSAEAVATLDRELSLERTQVILGRALGRSFLETARACLEALGQSGDTAAVEPSLLHALQREEAGLRIAAANALGRAGSAAAVLPLQEAAERSRTDRELHRAARQAIAEIQARLQGASPGQLSLAATDAGQLSLAQAETGHLSIAADPAGQLSHPSEEPEQPSPRAREGPPH